MPNGYPFMVQQAMLGLPNMTYPLFTSHTNQGPVSAASPNAALALFQQHQLLTNPLLMSQAALAMQLVAANGLMLSPLTAANPLAAPAAPWAAPRPTMAPGSATPEPTGREPALVYMDCDAESLSAYQCLVRKQIQVFEALREDVDTNAQGRNRPIVLGQVGIRCRHCTMLSPKHRARGAVYYPARLTGLYQAAQNMAVSHLAEHCQHVPEDIRTELKKLRERKSSAGGGKKYWAEGVRVLGVYEGHDGLRFEAKAPAMVETTVAAGN